MYIVKIVERFTERLSIGLSSNGQSFIIEDQWKGGQICLKTKPMEFVTAARNSLLPWNGEPKAFEITGEDKEGKYIARGSFAGNFGDDANTLYIVSGRNKTAGFAINLQPDDISRMLTVLNNFWD